MPPCPRSPSGSARHPRRRAGAARSSFAEQGFRGTTIRAVAAAAGVDPALVHHYFGTKDDLFVAAIELPVDPREVVAPVVAAGPDEAGERFLTRLPRRLGRPGRPDRRCSPWRARVLDDDGERLVPEGFLPVVIGPVIAALGLDRPEDRMTLVASQVIGPDPDALRARAAAAGARARRGPSSRAYGPMLQRYLTGELPD